MRIRIINLLVVITLGGLLCLVHSSETKEIQTTQNDLWGMPVNGLQMSVSLVEPTKATNQNAGFNVAFRNIGERDVILNLGMMLGNGKAQLPSKIRLDLTDAEGKTRELHFFDRRYPGVAGRVDDYVVPLRVGSIYTLKLSLEQFWCPETTEFALKLTGGRYRISAEFEGTGACYVNLDMPAVKLMNFWKGKLRSNSLTFVRQ